MIEIWRFKLINKPTESLCVLSIYSFIHSFTNNEKLGAMFQVLHTRTSSLHYSPKKEVVALTKHISVNSSVSCGLIWKPETPVNATKKSDQDAISRALSAASVPFLWGSFVWMFKQGLIIAHAGLQLNI